MIVSMVAPWGTKYHYMSGIHTNVTTVQLPSGHAWYSYLWDKPQNGGNDPVNCVSVSSAVTVSGWREGGIGSMHYERTRQLTCETYVAATSRTAKLLNYSHSFALYEGIARH
jgi:hypothetical protein